jgi:hypothetical protein
MHRAEGTCVFPTEATDRLCLEIEAFLQLVLERASRARGRLGRYDHEVDANSLFVVVVRHVEAVLVLARKDLAFIASACVCARAAFEAQSRMIWLIEPHDPYQREARSARLARHDTKDLEKIASDQSTPKPFRKDSAERSRAFRDYAERVSDAIKAVGEYDTATPLPKVQELLDSFDSRRFYVYYRLLSAFVHSSRQSMRYFRRYLGADTVVRDIVGPRDWLLPFEVAWGSLFRSSAALLSLLDMPLEADEVAAVVHKWKQAVAALQSEVEP